MITIAIVQAKKKKKKKPLFDNNSNENAYIGFVNAAYSEFHSINIYGSIFHFIGYPPL